MESHVHRFLATTSRRPYVKHFDFRTQVEYVVWRPASPQSLQRRGFSALWPLVSAWVTSGCPPEICRGVLNMKAHIVLASLFLSLNGVAQSLTQEKSLPDDDEGMARLVDHDV